MSRTIITGSKSTKQTRVEELLVELIRELEAVRPKGEDDDDDFYMPCCLVIVDGMEYRVDFEHHGQTGKRTCVLWIDMPNLSDSEGSEEQD